MPLLRRFGWVAGVNARSGHSEPVVTGLGIAALLPVLVFLVLFFLLAGHYFPENHLPIEIIVLVAATLLITCVGFYDDKYPLPAKLRLACQFLASAPLIYLFVDFGQYSFFIALVLSAGLWLGAVWYLNLFNFMDGMDLITVVQGVSLSIGVAVLQSQYGNSPFQIMFALCIGLSLLGFAYFNWPPAKAFMGDAGSYGYGLLTGAMLLLSAQSAGYVAAFSLAAFYIVDATSTLFMRLFQGKNLAQAHRDHAYQRALDRGWSKRRVLFCVVCCNIGLIGLNTLQLKPVLLAASCLIWATLWILLLRSGRKTFAH